jgi:hypothetical protein
MGVVIRPHHEIRHARANRFRTLSYSVRTSGYFVFMSLFSACRVLDSSLLSQRVLLTFWNPSGMVRFDVVVSRPAVLVGGQVRFGWRCVSFV